MTGTHFDVAVRAITAALGTRLAPGITAEQAVTGTGSASLTGHQSLPRTRSHPDT